MGIPLALNPNADLGTVVPNTFYVSMPSLHFYVFQGVRGERTREELDLGDAHLKLALHMNQFLLLFMYKKIKI